MLRRELSMVISKPIRRNKKTSKSVVLIEPPRKVSTHDRIINVLKENKNGLPVSEIHFRTQVSSMGNLHHTIKFMVRAGELKVESCPHCSSTKLYKINTL
jgi:hypothetical protein